MFNSLVTTLDRYPIDTKLAGTNLLDPSKSGAVKEYQKVVAVGPQVRGIEVGDIVFINPKRYAVMKHEEGELKDGVIKDNPVVSYNFEILEIDGVPHLLLFDNDIKYVADLKSLKRILQLLQRLLLLLSRMQMLFQYMEERKLHSNNRACLRNQAGFFNFKI